MKYELAYSTFQQEEKDAIIEVCESDRFTMGEKVRTFENQFAKYFGKKYAIMVNSGSSANLIGIASLFHRKEKPLSRGDEVIVPCISWATTYYPLLQYGLKLKFVDVDISTLNYDINKLKAAVSDKTRMIVAVSILGNPCELDELSTICKQNDITLFEDNCESMGAKYKGKFTGTFGLINTFSTFFSHHISTGEGGLILTDCKEIYNLCLSLRNHGWTRDQEDDSPIFNKRDNDFFEAYRFILPGYNVRPSEINGAVGSIQLSKLDNYISTRRRNAEVFSHYFGTDERFIIQKEVGESSWFSFTMIANQEAGIDRSDVLPLLKSANIGHRIITGGNFLRHDVIKYFDYEYGSCENADTAHYQGFFVGNGPIDLEKEIKYLSKTLESLGSSTKGNAHKKRKTLNNKGASYEL